MAGKFGTVCGASPAAVISSGALPANPANRLDDNLFAPNDDELQANPASQAG